MRITQWGEYGTLCALHIARLSRDGKSPVGASDIAEALSIATDYTQQVLQRLRKGNIVESIRGPNGGYCLAKPEEEITLKNILIAAEGETFEIICDTKPISQERCATSVPCNLRDIWQDLKTHIDTYLDSKTLADLIYESDTKGLPVQIGTWSKEKAL